MLRLTSALSKFEINLHDLADPIATFRQSVIGSDVMLETEDGAKKMIYADYVASGRALRQVEEFVMNEVLPFYANSHTEQSFCGARMTRMREEARAIVARHCNANVDEHAVIFGGSGATTGINQAIHLFGVHNAVRAGEPVTVFVGPYEHHSNLLPWRESGAKLIEIREAKEGGADLEDLQQKLAQHASTGIVIGAFSAASNVTGVCTDPAPVSQLIKSHGGRILWDYAGGAPYLAMSMKPNGVDIDAIVFSPHKFVGGPAASGVLVIRQDAVVTTIPSRPGGGTVVFVNENQHDYVSRLEQREEGGTPDVIGDIRAALAILIKETIGQKKIDQINSKMSSIGMSHFQNLPQAKLLAEARATRLPIFSFVPHDLSGNAIDYKEFTIALSQKQGIQARGGCSCAGPYVHQLLDIDDQTSAILRADLLQGDDRKKPGFVRFNLSYLMDDDTIDAIFDGIAKCLEDNSQHCCE
ncbi:aminotransferase class V-fold PLP-dependent enzyme [Cognatishimia activa]|uniref:aminotransferase class V-fold PLP-dependent enzyme n=1 Tax=Cognatishimia activa TaxID=1715691 RepID=UPI00222FB71C|nr:aminotransferase class V-fold PLP-dependent enzyme [Cognatishimia activa]UZD91562.1 aminotransferase class V-fold PLP-dependent enzyme [Cognatishimia activa]